jgi:hypothetical protein
MNINEHKNFKYKNKDELKEKATIRAMEYLATRYEMTEGLRQHLEETELWFTSGRNDWYSPERRKVKIGLGSTKWHTYDRKTIGVTADEIVIPKLLLITVHIIHEFTHAIQHFQKRKYSEVETTKNEMDYIQSVSPCTLNRMEEVPDDLWERRAV